MNIGLIGAGAIARFLLEEINQKQAQYGRVTSIFVRNREKYHALETEFGVTLYTDIQAFLKSNLDIVVEAATIQAVQDLVPTLLIKKPVMLISVGALVDERLLIRLNQLANEHGHAVYLPSGAIGGLDLVQNAHALGNVTSVALTTRKPAKSLVDEVIHEATIIFEGTAAEAIQQFPKNMNVSIVLALASIGFEQTKVTLIADPQIDKNIHQIKIMGDFGEATIEVKNNPLPTNPKTSYLAAMSLIGTLKRIQSQVVIGR